MPDNPSGRILEVRICEVLLYTIIIIINLCITLYFDVQIDLEWL